VINHRNSFSYNLLVVIICEGPDHSMIKWLENAGAVWGKHSFSDLCHGDEQHSGQ
jgi:hypothetical protein